MGDAFAALRELGPRRWYLKVDSTLRGNVGDTLAAAMAAARAAAVILAPSFPERGRTVREGTLLVGGVPVSASQVARDEAAPVAVSDVPSIVCKQWKCAVERMRTGDYTSAAALATAMDEAIGRGARLLAMDAESSSELRLIAAAAERTGRRVLLAGSAGLARAVAAGHGLASPAPPPPPPQPSAGMWAALVVVGSRTSASVAQVSSLNEYGVECLRADEEGAAGRAAKSLREGHMAAVVPGAAGGGDAAADIGAEVFADVGVRAAMVLSGGATSRRFCELAGVTAMRIEGELEAGIAAGHAETPSTSSGQALRARVPLVIKGGAAGGARALVEAIRWIRAEPESAREHD